MSVAYYVSREDGDPSFAAKMDGKLIARDTEFLDETCRRLGIRELSTFVSASPEDLEGLLEDDEIEAVPEVEEAWYTPEEGLVVVDALLKAARADRKTDRKDLIADIDSMRAILVALKSEGMRWHLSIDF